MAQIKTITTLLKSSMRKEVKFKAQSKHLATLLKTAMGKQGIKSEQDLADKLGTDAWVVKCLLRGNNNVLGYLPSYTRLLTVLDLVDDDAFDIALKADNEISNMKRLRHERGIFERPKGSGIWWIRYSDALGKERREQVGTRIQARNLYQARKTAIREGKFDPSIIKSKHHDVSISEIIDDRIARVRAQNRKSANDIERHLNSWREYFKGVSARSITSAEIQLAVAQLGKGRLPSNGQKLKPGGRSVATVNRYLTSLKTAFKDAFDDGKLTKNPTLKVKISRENNSRVRYLSDEEESKLLAVMPKEYHPLVLVAIHSGMRKGEQLNLKWNDIDFQQPLPSITIRETKSGKGRNVPMNDILSQTLQSIPRMINNPYVFYGKGVGKHLQNGIKHSFWLKYLKAAGIENLHWHDLRHTFASRLVMGGVDLYIVSTLLGHADIKMTMRYAHLAPSHLKKAVDVLVKPAPKPALSDVEVSDSTSKLFNSIHGPVAQKDRAAVS